MTGQRVDHHDAYLLPGQILGERGETAHIQQLGVALAVLRFDGDKVDAVRKALCRQRFFVSEIGLTCGILVGLAVVW